MFYLSSSSALSPSLFFNFNRSFGHLFVLFLLLLHQFLFPSFIHFSLSVFVYLACFFILFIDSFCLFFYEKKQNPLWPYLLLADALFLSALTVVMGPFPLGLIFVFALILAQSLPLLLLGFTAPAVVFLLFLSFLLPLSFLWTSSLSFEDRLAVSFLTVFVLFFMFCFGYFLRRFLFVFRPQQSSDLILFKEKNFFSADLSLELARKLKPLLNSLLKDFSQSSHQAPKEPAFSFLDKMNDSLNRMRSFILNFIEYAELKDESFLETRIELKQFLEEIIKKAKNHPICPENLALNLKISPEMAVRGSETHLKKGFEHILQNAFEALQNHSHPQLNIQAYLEKSWLVLEFVDNGQGISDEDKNRIFDPLFSRRFGLRGLGLSYTQKVMQFHRARLSVKSSEKGTRLRIQFPRFYDFYNPPFLKKTFKKRKKVA